MNVKTKTLIMQEIKTTNDNNGNPRKALIVNSLKVYEKGHTTLNTITIDVGYRSSNQALKEEIGDYTLNEYDGLNWLESLNVPVKEYKRLINS